MPVETAILGYFQGGFPNHSSAVGRKDGFCRNLDAYDPDTSIVTPKSKIHP
jgi:hypothetical protein